MKTCLKCELPRPEGAFGRTKANKDGLHRWCKPCKRLYENSRTQSASDNVLAAKICGACGETKGLNEFHRHRKRRDGRHSQCKLCIARYQKRRLQDDPNSNLAKCLRVRLAMAVLNGQRAGSAVKDLGCTIPELKTWLEAKFYSHPETGEVMGWGNHGLRGWHIDHKRPLKDFDLANRGQFLEACHYTNLQPLWAEHNYAKGARGDWRQAA